MFERNDLKIAWSWLFDAGLVLEGQDASVTDNMSAILDYLLKEKRERYEGKIDTDHDS